MRALLLGCGSVGARHARNLVGLGLEVLAYDPDATRTVALAGDPQVTSVDDPDEAEGVDVVVISTPTHRHLADLEWALRRGYHTFVEKPLGATRGDLSRAIALRDECPDPVAMVACNLRFTEGFRTLRENVRSIGEVVAVSAEFGWYLPNWRPQQDYHAGYSAHRDQGGGIILDAIHEIDYVVTLAGPVADVSAMWRPGVTLGIDAEELAEVTLRHVGGAVSSLHLDYLQPRYTRACRVTGPHGTLLWDFAQHRVERWWEGSADPEILLDGADPDVNSMYVAEMAHFLDAVRSGEPTLNSIGNAAAVLDVALTALERGEPR
jgi:predicted dehydrogenase